MQASAGAGEGEQMGAWDMKDRRLEQENRWVQQHGTSDSNVNTNTNTNDDGNAAAAPHPNPRVISLAEVALHSAQDDCWVVADGHVLDVTAFIASHPGGVDKIMTLSAGSAPTFSFASHFKHTQSVMTRAFAQHAATGAAVTVTFDRSRSNGGLDRNGGLQGDAPHCPVGSITVLGRAEGRR